MFFVFLRQYFSHETGTCILYENSNKIPNSQQEYKGMWHTLVLNSCNVTLYPKRLRKYGKIVAHPARLSSAQFGSARCSECLRGTERRGRRSNGEHRWPAAAALIPSLSSPTARKMSVSGMKKQLHKASQVTPSHPSRGFKWDNM